MTRPSLRLPLHRGTTAHLASLYPFSVQGALGADGPYVGVDLLAGGAEFCWDPFDAYAAGLVTNPNCWIMGEPGHGKSSLVKCLLWRMAGVYGSGARGRWIAIADPKGEYALLAERLGLPVIRLAPGGSVRINPLADPPGGGDEPSDVRVLRRSGLVAALVATVLGRQLTQLEDAAIFAAVDGLLERGADPTLVDLVHVVTNPPIALAERLRGEPSTLATDLGNVRFALDKLLSRSLRGMFDGPSTVTVPVDGPGLVLDLSAVPLDSEALPLVMVAAAGWLSHVLATPGPRRVQVLDEAWALLGNRHTASYLQTCFKLGRSYGVANICIAHRPSDLAAQADDGTATAKIAAGLLADAATKIVLRQAPDQLDLAAEVVGLSEPEQTIIGQLARGRALWKVGGRTAVVHHLLSSSEAALCDTDARMTLHATTAA
jgi:type IV secretory pathway VirB4 component